MTMFRSFVFVLLCLLAVPVLAQDDPPPLDPETLTARELLRLPLLSAPARSSAHLAPDGETFMHVRGTTFCLHALLGVEIGCSDMVEQGVVESPSYNIDPESISWSPDGRYMAFTTEVWTMLRDSDIWVLDVDSGRFHNMTDDGYDGRILFGGDIPDRATVDTAPTWMPDGRLSFARHAASRDAAPPVSLWTVGATGGMAEKLTDLTAPSEDLTIVFAMDWSPDGTTLAYVVDSPDNPDAGIWLYDSQSGETRFLFPRPETMRVILRVEFSPDGESLLVLSDERDEVRGRGSGEDRPAGYYVIDVESGEATPFAAEHFISSAGWLPDGGLVYVGHLFADRSGGLYVTAAADRPARKVLDYPLHEDAPLPFFAPTGRQFVPIYVSANGRLLLATARDLTVSVELAGE